MKSLLLLPLMAMLQWSEGLINPSAPGCASRCWENTQYVSKRKCASDAACLCTEPDYQNPAPQVVFQCLYSQCDTVHFGSALHHIIAQCFGTGSGLPLFAAPPIPNREDLRRREAEYAAGAKLYGSGSAVGFPTESVSFLTQSAGYATQSVGGPYSPSPTSPSWTSPSLDTAASLAMTSTALSFDTAVSPAMTSATASQPIYNAILLSTTAARPQIFIGLASTLGPAGTLAVLAFIATLYLTL
ncbi:hypothetical protein NA56DRAFT_664679 [Hyaloscypha hepaticicola]|uniref:CFEM domain-containing protein n=1 Tax=Hyaloscypha hepaticicola TaxID=2082293 RepID=A0A2J6PJV7_9HELO|nr:hypothetical protein NA56DRAFT_664679 [Hyaloscypha hepaticicola]